MYTSHVCPDLVLPTSEERLCLHNVLPADTNLFHFGLLDYLKSFKVGGRAKDKGV